MDISEDKAWELVEECIGFKIDIEDDYKHFIALHKREESPLKVAGPADKDRIFPVSYAGYSYKTDSNDFKLHFNLHIAHTTVQYEIPFLIQEGKAVQVEPEYATLIRFRKDLRWFLKQGYQMTTLNFKRALSLNHILKEGGIFSLLAFNTKTLIVREDKSITKEALRLSKAEPDWLVSRLFDNVHEPLNSDWYICEFESFYEYYHILKDKVGLDTFMLNKSMVIYARNNGVQWVERGDTYAG